MQTKQYRAANIQQALELVRNELGPDASVLHTREMRGGLFGWFGPKEIEVTASVDVEVPSRFNPKVEVRRRQPAASSDSLVEALCQQHDQSWRVDGNGPLVEVHRQLVAAELGESLATELVQRLRTISLPADLRDEARVRLRLARMLEDELICCGPIAPSIGKCKRVALVGPTGVGKTTTIAKLAAHFRVNQSLKVGLISVDANRVAAVGQLRTYADMIEAPVEVVSTRHQMRLAVDRMRNFDLVLIDTAGRSPSDSQKINQLRDLLVEADTHEIHLVLSAVVGASSVRAAVQRFSALSVTAIITTKIDEAVGLGGLPQVCRQSGLPLSYITNGQRVPGDMSVADAEMLAQQIINYEAVV